MHKEVRVLKLVSGEDIISTVRTPRAETENGECTYLEKPQIMIMQPAGDGKLSFSFFPFFPFAKGGDVAILTSAITINQEPHAELLNNYNRAYGSGLVIAETLPPGNGHGGLHGARAM
jgi:hypothetical protein